MDSISADAGFLCGKALETVMGLKENFKDKPCRQKTALRERERKTFSVLRQRVRNKLVTSKSGTLILQ
jgi:hypothetical protein